MIIISENHRFSRESGKQIIATGDELANERETAEGKSGIEARIKELEQHTKDDIFRRYDDWEKEKRFFTLAASEAEELQQLSTARFFDIRHLPAVPEHTPNEAIIRHYAEVYNTVKNDAEQTAQAIGEDIQRGVNTLSSISDHWREKYAEEEYGLIESLRILGFSDRAQIYKELQDKKTELARIVEHVEPRIETLKASEAALKAQRKDLLDVLHGNREALTTRRQEIADHFNRELGDTVRISITEKADRAKYAEMFDMIYDGSGMRGRDVIFDTLVEKAVYPDRLAAVIFDKDSATLEAWGIPRNGASVLCSHPSVEQLFELQTCRIDDIPQIYLKKEGEYDFTPLSHLSFKATIGPVVMLRANSLICASGRSLRFHQLQNARAYISL